MEKTAREEKDVGTNMTTVNPKKRRIVRRQEYSIIKRAYKNKDKQNVGTTREMTVYTWRQRRQMQV